MYVVLILKYFSISQIHVSPTTHHTRFSLSTHTLGTHKGPVTYNTSNSTIKGFSIIVFTHHSIILSDCSLYRALHHPYRPFFLWPRVTCRCRCSITFHTHGHLILLHAIFNLPRVFPTPCVPLTRCRRLVATRWPTIQNKDRIYFNLPCTSFISFLNTKAFFINGP